MAVRYTKTAQYVLFVVMGNVTNDEIIGAIKACWREHDSRLALWDAREASLSSLSYDCFEEIMGLGAKSGERRGDDARSAVVARNATDLNLIRAVLAHTPDQAPVVYAAFLKFEDAESWLLADASAQ